MFWFKKYKCQECGTEYSQGKYSIQQEGGDIILCKKCFDNYMNQEEEKHKKEENDFENKKNSMKFKESIDHFFTLKQGDKEVMDIQIKIEIYSNKKLTKEELQGRKISSENTIACLPNIDLVKPGEILLNSKFFIMNPKEESKVDKEGIAVIKKR